MAHTSSNATLDTPWPKTKRLRAVLEDWVTPGCEHVEVLFDTLADRRIAPDCDLPRTGIPLDWERKRSPAFIKGTDYGTCASTIVLLSASRMLGPQGVMLGETDQIRERL